MFVCISGLDCLTTESVSYGAPKTKMVQSLYMNCYCYYYYI